MNTQEKTRIFIIIDGNNFYHRLKEQDFKALLKFDYERFANFLNNSRGELKTKCYYIGAVRENRNDLKSVELMKNQRILTDSLQKNGWGIKFGHLLKSDVFHEKGVDVQMAVDLLVGAYEDKYDLAILVSSDTDLLPAIMKVRAMKKRIEYIGFRHRPSFALIANSDSKTLLFKEDIQKFLPQKHE